MLKPAYVLDYIRKHPGIAPGKSHIAKASANVIKFCKTLDDLPINFRFKLNNVSKDFDGS